jgi:hypothetical protein
MATLRFLPAASQRRRGYAPMNLAGYFSGNAAAPPAKIFRSSRRALHAAFKTELPSARIFGACQ